MLIRVMKNNMSFAVVAIVAVAALLIANNSYVLTDKSGICIKELSPDISSVLH
jgi:hypothetical protein